MEKKYLTRPFEVKEISEDGTFEGYGSVFHNVDHSRDVVLPGAFLKSLSMWKSKKRMPPILWQHDQRQPIGVYEDIYEDEVGLFVKGRLLVDGVGKAKEAHALMLAGAISGLSIGYMTKDGEYDRENDCFLLKELDLWEVSPVTFPDNDLARVTAVKNIDDIQNIRDFENFLRESGFSKSEAIRIASKGFERRESASEDAEIIELIRQTSNIFRGENHA